jgi:DNA-binding SARP family transcriptional activator
VYLSGELAAAQGRTKSARHTFALAADLFTANHDDSGACQSLLAASALEAQQGDMSKAQASALAAKSIAETAGLMEHQSWTVWQLGRLAALRGELDDALAYFDQATVAPHVRDQSSFDLGQQIKSLLQRQRELHQKHESSRQAYLAAEQDERQALRQLDAAINNPSLGWLAGLKGYGQSHAPLTLKLPMSTHGPPRRASILERLARTMGLGQKSPEDAVALSAITPKAIPTQAVPTEEPTDIPTVLSVAQNTTETATVAASEPIAAPAVTPTLTVYMLGTFRVAVNGRSIDKWPSGRGRAVLKYLLMHTSRPTPRDVLMETFWPDSAPDASRNNLNVALYGLRRALRAVTDLPVIVFEDGTYRLNSDFQLWIDVGEFERQAAAGQRLEITGKLSAAVKQYEAAVNLYQDDFLADDPYEEWTVLPREKFRIVYLDTLDRLSRIFFNQAQYDDCARLCKLILSRDNCREDTHCCLMRCYSRLGQHHLAVRQYQVCVEALAAQLEIDPSPDTTQLYKLICRREAV